jgi:hypothetical protein
VSSNRLVGAVTSDDCLVCAMILGSRGGYLIGPAFTESDCQLNYRLFMAGENIPGFLQGLHARGVSYKISGISKVSAERGLTSKQERVLKSALETGYYDYPKRTSTEDLAGSLGISRSTVSEILRRAERRIISEYFERS